MLSSTVRTKPTKPFPTFPLTPHNNGQWCKKVRGKLHFFGVWSDPDAALAKYHETATDLHTGRSPQPKVATPYCTVKELVNRFLAFQSDRVAGRQIGGRWFEDCRRALKHFSRKIGSDREAEQLTAAELLSYRTGLVRYGLSGRKGLGVHALTRTLIVVRSLFAWGQNTGLIERIPLWGNALDKPSAADRRRTRAKRDREHGKNLFTAAEIRMLIKTADNQLRPAVLLGINAGFGNTDCSELPRAAVNLDAARIDFERPKTAVGRIVPLWPETVTALRKLLAMKQSKPIDAETAALVFRTESGRPLVRQVIERNADGSIKKATAVDRLGDRFDALLEDAGLKRHGLGFYGLRHTFRTWADEIHDQHAIDIIMGHAITGMAAHYIEEISFDRLKAVTEHVHAKLYRG